MQRLLRAVQPLMFGSALRPKQLASLARAVNTLALTSPATNSRQAVSTGQVSASLYAIKHNLYVMLHSSIEGEEITIPTRSF